jgi:hypothetical protein
VLFLAAFITMFYFDDDLLLKKLLFFYICGSLGFILFFALGLHVKLEPALKYPSDWLTLVFLTAYCIYAWKLARNTPALRKKYQTSLILAFTTPFLVGLIFKYLLLVLMPTEGLVVSGMDVIWYWAFQAG